MNNYNQKTFRPVFLSFLNRELVRLRNLNWSEQELSKFIKVCCLMSAGPVYAPFAQTQELLHNSPQSVDIIKSLCAIDKLRLINAENDFLTFIDGRRDMYGQLKPKYKCYFTKKQPLSDQYTKSEKLDTSSYIKRELLSLVSTSTVPNWITYEEITRVRSQKDFIRNDLQEKNFAATFSLYEISRVEPKPRDVRLLGDISSKLFKHHYNDSYDAVSPTGILHDEILEDYEYFPLFDLNVNFHLLSALKLDRLILQQEYTNTLSAFITHRDFHHFIEAKNRFLGIIHKAVESSETFRPDNSLYVSYISALSKNLRVIGQDFDPIAYCEVIASTTKALRDHDINFYSAMDEDDINTMSRNNIVIFTATNIEDDILKEELINFDFQFIGKDRAAEYFYSTYSLYDTIHLHHMRTSMGSGNVGGSQRASHELFNKFKPDYAISAGICFGADNSKQKLGDVIVADAVRLYEQAAARGGAFQFRGPSVPLNPTLPSYAMNGIGDSWPFKIHVGAMLTGEKLVDDADYKARILAMDPKAVGGEMEAAGIQTSAIVKGVPVGLIKGICDWGVDKNKGAQEGAAQNAMRYTLSLIKDVWRKK